MTYASPRGIKRAQEKDSVNYPKKLRGLVKHRDDMDKITFAKQPKKKEKSLFQRMLKFMSGKTF